MTSTHSLLTIANPSSRARRAIEGLARNGARHGLYLDQLDLDTCSIKHRGVHVYTVILKNRKTIGKPDRVVFDVGTTFYPLTAESAIKTILKRLNLS